jgi:hypothetical protein
MTRGERLRCLTSGFAVMLGVVGLSLAAPAARAQDTPRLSDADLKALIENVDHARDRFEDALDGDFKHSTVRGPRGEVQVNQYLDDLQENVNRLKDRYNSGYAASAEARTVLQQGTDIHRYMQGQPDSMKGKSEWDRLAGNLGTLAHAYATTFPLPPDASVRRINDKEAAETADAAVKAVDAFKKAAGNDPALPKEQRQTLKDRADTLAKACKDVRSRLKDHKPGTAEARQMFDAFEQVSQSASSASSSTLSALGPVRASMETLRQAFGLAPPPPMR